MRRIAGIGWIVGVVALATLPFLGRAVFLDEHLLLQLARSVLTNGVLAHLDVPTVFFGIPLANLSAHTHPPVVEYCLALLYKVFGGFNGPGFRLVFSAFPLCAALAFFDLARRFTRSPLLVTLLFAASPAFFVMSSTLMADIPALAFLLLAFALYFRGFLWVASFSFALAFGTMYPALIPFGCLLVWMAFNRRPAREFSVLAAAPAVLGVWLVVTAFHFHQIPLLETMGYLGTHGSSGQNALAALSFVGGAAVCPWAFILLRRDRRNLLSAVVAVLLVVVVSALHEWPSIPYLLAYYCMASAGAALLASFAASVFRSRQGESPVLLFTLWLAATLLFFVMVAEWMAARYLLLMMPPLYVVCFSEIRQRRGAAILVPTLALSFTLSLADYRLAGSYRDWVSRTIPALQREGFTVWSGAESGLRFYLEENGIRPLSMNDLSPAAGHLIVRQDLFQYGLAGDLGTELIPIHSEDFRDSLPLRTLSTSAGAGFHDSRAGLLPYAISSVPLDRVSVVEVSPLLKSLPQIVPRDFSSVPVWSRSGVLLKQVEDEMIFHPKIPKGSTVLYERKGTGELQLGPDTIRLIKQQHDPVLWTNLRIVPSLFGNPQRQKD